MIISEKSFDTSMPSVMYAITRLITSRFLSMSRSSAGLRREALSSFTSPFLCSITTPPGGGTALLPDISRRLPGLSPLRRAQSEPLRGALCRTCTVTQGGAESRSMVGICTPTKEEARRDLCLVKRFLPPLFPRLALAVRARAQSRHSLRTLI